MVDQDEEICGQKEPRSFEFKSPREFEEFVRVENQFEKDIESQLQGNKMPYRWFSLTRFCYAVIIN